MRSTLVSPSGSGGLRARLVLAAPDALEPFVVLHAGRFARILLAELVGEDGVAQARFAWKLRVDVVAADAIAGRKPPSNAELDAIWQVERKELLRVRSPFVVPPVAVPPALTRSAPVFYCRRVDRYFHPVCPETGAVLRVCRDDARLQEAGLKPYGDDTVRYLHHGLAEGPATFYRIDGESERRGDVRIATAAELIRGWSGLVHGGTPVADLPCPSCPHRAECFPLAGGDARVPAEDQVHVVSFYDVDSIALELAATDFDTAITRLGGGDGDGVGGVWMTGADPRSRTLEALRLKVAAFADVCRGVLAVHEGGRPHLGIAPTNVVALDVEGGSALPANWRFRFALTDMGGALPVRVPGGSGQDGEVLWQPGREIAEDATARLFLAPLLRSLEGGSVTMSVVCREEATADGGARCVVEVHRAGVPAFVLPGDVVVVQPLAGDVAPMSARVEDVGARGLRAAILSDATSLACLNSQPFEARLRFVRRSSPSADLYGLGMLLLRVLLVHDEQAMADVAAAVERCLQQLMSTEEPEDGGSLADRWQEILDGDDGEGRFAPWNVMHLRRDRQAVFDADLKGTPIIPHSIWSSLLALAGRLLLASPVARGGEREGKSPLVGVLNELARLERRLHVELLDRSGRDRALSTVCAERAVALRAELDQSDPAGEGASAEGESGGFVLAVGRVGESAIQQYHFTQDRVTIGRREGDNVLHLPDPMVSSKHAVIEFADGEYSICDRGSTNGTEVDGIRLPIEVPHPLDDGAVVHIRPFLLSFRRAESVAMQTATVPLLSTEELYEQLCVAYAEARERGDVEVRTALTAALDRARASLGRKGLLNSLDEILTRLGAPGQDSVQVPT